MVNPLVSAGPLAGFTFPLEESVPLFVNVTSTALPGGAVRGLNSRMWGARLFARFAVRVLLPRLASMLFEWGWGWGSGLPFFRFRKLSCPLTAFLFDGSCFVCVCGVPEGAVRTTTTPVFLNPAQVPGATVSSTAVGVGVAEFDPRTRVVRCACVCMSVCMRESGGWVGSAWCLGSQLLACVPCVVMPSRAICVAAAWKHVLI